jgi:hypothetical protein
MHELLRHLPPAGAAARGAAQRFLAQPAHGLDEAEIGRWAAEALAVTERPAMRAVRRRLARRGAADRHGRDAARQLHRQRPGRPAGRHGREVLIVDYKTNRPPPGEAQAWRSPIAASSRSIARCCGDLSVAHGARFPAVDGGAAADGDRCRNARPSMPYTGAP